MKTLYIAVAVSMITGFAAAAILLQKDPPRPVVESLQGGAAAFDQSAPIDARIRALEAAIAEEREARQLLEEELYVLSAEFDDIRQVAPVVDRAAADSPRERDAPPTESFRQTRSSERSAEARVDALVDAGFSPDRAAWILQREDQLRVEAMQARFDAQRAGDMQAMFTANNRSETLLREELGDLEYEQYLAANNRPTMVEVGGVLDSSPGQIAGLQAGDQISRYDGRRVFSYADINDQQLRGEPGETVVVDVVRDGTLIQVVMPRGPIGIQAGRFRSR